MRSAGAVEKVSSQRPEWLAPHKRVLLDIAARTGEQELRWHLAQMLPRLPLTPAERQRAVALMPSRDGRATQLLSAVEGHETATLLAAQDGGLWCVSKIAVAMPLPSTTLPFGSCSSG
jgi:hypothetical protein